MNASRGYRKSSALEHWCAGALVCLWFVLAGCGSTEEARPPRDSRPARAPIVVVFNGCGAPGSAREVAEAIRRAGYDVGNGHGENADSFEYPSTLVVDYVGQHEAATRLAALLAAPLVRQISRDPDRFGTIGVVVGADWRARLAHIGRR